MLTKIKSVKSEGNYWLTPRHTVHMFAGARKRLYTGKACRDVWSPSESVVRYCMYDGQSRNELPARWSK